MIGQVETWHLHDRLDSAHKTLTKSISEVVVTREHEATSVRVGVCGGNKKISHGK